MRSLSEIETTSKRATRAAGFSWGIAEEVGKLSWEDYKAFNSGWGKMNRLSVKNCTKNKNIAEKILNNYLKDLSNRVNKELGIQP